MKCSRCEFRCVSHWAANEHEKANPMHVVEFYFTGKNGR